MKPLDDWPGMLPFPVVMPDWQGVPARVKAFTTLRDGGCSQGEYGAADGSGGFNLADHVGDSPLAVRQNRDKLNLQLPSHVTFLSQVHGNIVVDAANLASGEQADAVFSARFALVCAVLTADCLPVLLTDKAGKVVAAAHAGWRGLAAGVLENTVAAMRDKGAVDIVAWLGPAIGPDEFEVGRDVFDAFAVKAGDLQECFSTKGNAANEEKYLADIYGLARKLLSPVGVVQIFGGNRCTVRESTEFYSYRRDGICGRMASLIWMEPD